MQEKEYAQVYELGLGSLVGDFFQNVKDTVTGVAKAVAPIAPFVLPFVAPGIGSLVGGSVGKFLTSKLGHYRSKIHEGFFWKRNTTSRNTSR